MTDVLTYGFYGKIPCLGDFVRRGLSQGFVGAWDEWLQSTMTRTARMLGPGRWDDAYLSAPLWRFALAPGLCGSQAVVGVLMPSVDAVGRRFPLCIATETDLPLCAAYLAMQPALPGLEDAALSALGEGTTLAAFESRLAALPAPRMIGDAPESTGSLWTTEADGRTYVLTAPDMPRAETLALFDLGAAHWTRNKALVS